MKTVCASLVLISALIIQVPSGAVGPRVAAVPENQRTDEQRSIVAKFVSSGMPNAVATYVNHPTLADHILPYEHYASSDSTLPPRHRALIGLRTAWLTRSDYLWAHRAGESRRIGFTTEDFTRVAQGPDAKGWDAFDALVLRAADELHVDTFVSDPTWKGLSARYDTNQLVDLVDGVGVFTLHAGAINSLGIEIEPDLPDRLPSAIPYGVAAKRTNLRLVDKAARIPPLEPKDWTPEQRKRFDPNGTGQRAANVFVTFVRNPPADRLRGPINQHVLNGTTLSARQRETLLMRIGVLCRSEYKNGQRIRVWGGGPA